MISPLLFLMNLSTAQLRMSEKSMSFNMLGDIRESDMVGGALYNAVDFAQ